MGAEVDPAALTPAAARARVREIRGRLRPRLLAELRELYAGAGPSEVREIAAAEERLQQLDQSLLHLLPALERPGRPLGWDAFRPALRKVERQGTVRIEGEVDLAFSPENHECVHGPATAVPVVGLAGRLLAQDERLTAIERITWAEPLRHRVRLTVWDADLEAAPAGAAAFGGRLRTSGGRALDFAGVALPAHPLLAQRGYNGLARALVAGQRLVFGPAPESVALALAEDGLAVCRQAVRRHPALAAAVGLDLVPLAILNWKRGRPMVACGYRDVPLPAPSTAAFGPDTRLELRSRADRSHPSARSGLWIAHYEFRYPPRQEAWSTMVMAEADDLALLLRKLHA